MNPRSNICGKEEATLFTLTLYELVASLPFTNIKENKKAKGCKLYKKNKGCEKNET